MCHLSPGGMGGYIASSRATIEHLRSHCSGIMTHNAMSPIVCAQIIRSFKVRAARTHIRGAAPRGRGPCGARDNECTAWRARQRVGRSPRPQSTDHRESPPPSFAAGGSSFVRPRPRSRRPRITTTTTTNATATATNRLSKARMARASALTSSPRCATTQSTSARSSRRSGCTSTATTIRP